MYMGMRDCGLKVLNTHLIYYDIQIIFIYLLNLPRVAIILDTIYFLL